MRSLGWLALGTSLVAGLYGAIGALVGPSIPQLSHALIGRFPVRLIQSSVVFGILGLVLLVMGLASLRGATLRLPRTRGREILGLLLIGGLIGATFATLVILPAIFAILQGNQTRQSPSLHPADGTGLDFSREQSTGTVSVQPQHDPA